MRETKSQLYATITATNKYASIGNNFVLQYLAGTYRENRGDRDISFILQWPLYQINILNAQKHFLKLKFPALRSDDR